VVISCRALRRSNTARQLDRKRDWSKRHGSRVDVRDDGVLPLRPQPPQSLDEVKQLALGDDRPEVDPKWIPVDHAGFMRSNELANRDRRPPQGLGRLARLIDGADSSTSRARAKLASELIRALWRRPCSSLATRSRDTFARSASSSCVMPRERRSRRS
jgi:hypothetical protein